MAKIEMVGKNVRRQTAEAASYLDIFIFLLPALQFIQFRVIGVLSASDILIVLMFITLFFSRKIRIAAPIGRKTLILCTLWLISQIASDVMRHTPFKDYTRGWSAIGLTIMVFCLMFSLLNGSPRRVNIYTCGLIAGALSGTFFGRSEFEQVDDIWKFGLSLPVTLSVLLIASRKDVRGPWPSLLIASNGVLNFLMGFRNQGEVCLAAAFYVMVTRFAQKNRNAEHRRVKPATVVAIAGLVVFTTMGIYFGYQRAAASGNLGDEARDKYEKQSSGKYGVLLGGRIEWIGSLAAVYDSPIFGHGSFPKDPKYLLMETQALASMGYEAAGEMDPETLKDGAIPTHSHLLGAWVNAGILGGLFWGWIWFLACKMLFQTYPSGIKLLPLASYAAFELLWDVLFSPYGAQMRLFSPFYAVIVITYLGVAQPNLVKAIPAKMKVLRPA